MYARHRNLSESPADPQIIPKETSHRAFHKFWSFDGQFAICTWQTGEAFDTPIQFCYHVMSLILLLKLLDCLWAGQECFAAPRTEALETHQSTPRVAVLKHQVHLPPIQALQPRSEKPDKKDKMQRHFSPSHLEQITATRITNCDDQRAPNTHPYFSRIRFWKIWWYFHSDILGLQRTSMSPLVWGNLGMRKAENIKKPIMTQAGLTNPRP